jgi:prevent-host-death family protein
MTKRPPPPTKPRIRFDPDHKRCGFANDGAWASRNIDGKNLDMRALGDACGKPYETIAAIRRGFAPITSDLRPVLEAKFGEDYDTDALARWRRENAKTVPPKEGITPGQWETAEASQRFGELVEAAAGHGPQVVMRQKEPVAVVLSPKQYRRLVRQANTNFANLLARSPLAPEDLEPVGMSLSGDA